MTRSKRTRRVASHPITRRVLRTTLLAAVGLAGCADNQTALVLNEPQRRHAIQFADRTEKLFVEVGPRGYGLSENQHVDVVRFLERFKAESTGRLKIVAPTGGSADRSVRDVSALALEAGISPQAVTIDHLRSSGSRRALQLSFVRPVAIPPVCEDWTEDLGHNRDRVNYPNFGCATQRSLGLMVANPRDLMEPRPETPRGSERREATWSTYTKGTAAGAAPAASAAAAPSTPPATK
jgi:pilus assembly protein CpaD